ncbi:hypothetical protein DYB31_004016 [Aphanomyces astaci]|uniref:Uncharacterized protein n=1 Tax=Aphanomyces astaci TaxID=112090 RepID=A0A397FXL8_APHAT|nr:hypothetical protein DYB31_004016 [Aphanomyces astaci]
MRTEETKAIAAAAAKEADEAAKEAAEAARKVTSEGVTGTPSGDGEHPNATGVGGKEGKASGVGAAVKTEAKVKAELELGFHWDRSRIFTPAGWGGVGLGYVRDVTRRLTVVGEFDETNDDWGYQTANAAGVERYLRLFASPQSFELRVLWMLLAMECMQLARVSFHRFDEFKGAMRELHEREHLERWTVDVGRIELCNDETLLEYLVADDVGGGACARGAVEAKRVFGAPCERLVERMGFADGEFFDVGARRCAGASNGCVGGSAIVCGAAGESVCGVQSAIGVTTVWTGDSGGAACSRGLSGCAAPQQVLGSMSRTATPGAPGEEEKSMAAEEEEPPRDPEDRLPSLHRS